MKLNCLDEEETKIIINKDTESPFTGKFYEHKESGIYNANNVIVHCIYQILNLRVDVDGQVLMIALRVQ